MELFNDDGTITETGRRMERELKEIVLCHCKELPTNLDIRTYADILRAAGIQGSYQIIARRKEAMIKRGVKCP